MTIIQRAKRYGFLRRPCAACGQRMVVARSGKACINCGAAG